MCLAWGSMDSFPADVLRLIIGNIPWYPRVLVLSVLSKRFNKLVRESVSYLPALDPPRCIAALRVLPHVRRIHRFHLGHGHQQAAGIATIDHLVNTTGLDQSLLPASITSLRFDGVPAIRVTWALCRLPLTNLQSLELSYSIPPQLFECVSLTNLYFDCGPKMLATRLTSLFPRLLSLGFGDSGFPAEASSYTFPLLRLLRLPTDSAWQVARVRHLFPCLTELHTQTTSQECVHALQVHMSGITLHIRDTRVWKNREANTFNQLHQIAKLFTSIRMGYYYYFQAHTALTKLSISGGWSAFASRLPKLQKLRICARVEPSYASVVTSLAFCPILRKLTVRMDSETDDIVALGIAAVGHGVEQLVIRTKHKRMEVPEAVFKFKWLRVTLVHCLG